MPEFLSGGGELGALIRAHDWAATPLGSPHDWHSALKTMVATGLRSALPSAIYWGAELHLIYNDAWAPIPADRHPEALGRPAREVWRDIWEVIDPQFRQVIGSGQGFVATDQLLLMERGGVPRETYWNYSFTPILGQDGAVLGILNQGTETTDRVRAERTRGALAESETRLQLALSASNTVGAWDWDVAKDRVTSDAEFARLFGVDPEIAEKGAPISEFMRTMHPDDLDRVRENIERTLATGGKFSDEYRLVLDDGSVHWVLALRQVVLGENGMADRFPGLCFNITERKRVEEELRHLNETLETQVEERARQLRESEAKSQMVLAALNGVVTWDYDIAADRFVSDGNFARIYGGDPERAERGVALKNVFHRVHPEDLPNLRQQIADSLVGGGDAQVEYRLMNPDGSVRWMLSRSQTHVDAEGKAIRVTGVGVDITEQRQLEERLRQSQKMEAVGQLTGGIAHDFNNLLTGISGAMEMLQVRLKQGRVGDLDRYIGAAQEASKRAAALTHRLLAFSRRQTLDPRPTDVNRLVTGLEEMIRRTVGPACKVEVVEAAGLWPALVDPNQLENALLNLCINARDAMPEGGRITIETGNKWLDERAARERDLPPGQFLSLYVTDTGSGMAPDVIERAFDPFFTTKPQGQGTGLGLSMIYGFARQSGGQVRIYSEVGEGTTMCIYLPRHFGSLDDIDEAESTVFGDQSEAGETVLVVDDEPTVRMLVAEVLEDLGYTAIEAADGAAAIRIVKTDARIDLLITDIGLPGGMNGRQVAENARALRPGLGVLFITGYAENAVIGNAPLDAGTQLITKPFSMDALGKRVRDMIGGK